MVKKNIHQPVEIVYEKLVEAPVVDNRNTFFQMVYIISGLGSTLMNGNRTAYREGSLLLLTPNDCYAFEIRQATEFLFIKFSSNYVRDYKWTQQDCLESLLYHASHVSGCVLQHANDIILAKMIAHALWEEASDGRCYGRELSLHLVNALIVLAARNIVVEKPKNLKPNADGRIQRIIEYIQGNIHYPSRVAVPELAHRFGISPTYLGRYFSNHCGETIQEFIAKYRLRLIEHRLMFSDMRINEIAAEFGFVDDSHLNKFFKKHRNMSLTEYRRSRS